MKLSKNKQSIRISSEAVKALAKTLETTKTLTSLDLSYNDIESEDTKVLVKVLGTNQSSITSLCLGRNYIDDNKGQAIATAIETNKTLTNLDLRWSKMGSNGIQAFAKALLLNQTLRNLNLQGGFIDSVGAIALAETLKVNRTLSSLNLQGNQISDAGAKAFANTLKINKTLRNLDFTGAWNWSGGADVFAEALEKNDTLKDLNLGDTGVTHEGGKTFEKVLKTNESLIGLNLYDFNLHYFGPNPRRSPTRGTKIHAYLNRNRALLLKKSKQLDKALESSSLIPPLVKIIKEYADLPAIEQKPGKFTNFLKRWQGRFQLLLKKIYKFIQNQLIKIKDKFSTKKSDQSNATRISNSEQRQPAKTVPSLVSEKAPIFHAESPSTDVPVITCDPGSTTSASEPFSNATNRKPNFATTPLINF